MRTLKSNYKFMVIIYTRNYCIPDLKLKTKILRLNNKTQRYLNHEIYRYLFLTG